MTRRQLRALARMREVLTFLDIPGHQRPRLADLYDELVRSRERIDAWDVRQLSARQSRGSAGRVAAVARRNLRRLHVVPIARRGKLLLKGLPGIEESLRVPHSRSRDPQLITAAKRIGDAVRSHTAAFVAVGFPVDFVARLEAATDALAACTSGGNQAVADLSRATLDIRAELSAAAETIAVIDSIVVAEFDGENAILANWRAASRIPGQPGRPLKKRERARPQRPRITVDAAALLPSPRDHHPPARH